MDIEEAVRRAVAASTRAPAFYEVPSARPEAFSTVELSGDGSSESGVLCDALVTVSCWSADRRAAHALYRAAKEAVQDIASEDSVMAASVASSFRDRDLDSGWHRYRFVIQAKYCE